MLRKIVGTILICTGIGVTLHQIFAYGCWEWEQMLRFPHHESIAWIAAIAGLLLWASALRWKGAVE